jgi:hypothetical protein
MMLTIVLFTGIILPLLRDLITEPFFDPTNIYASLVPGLRRRFIIALNH